ncbi:MAG: hypothetical protein LBM87_02410, partial [Ruminococcus sp.]|nr:hypothetical protein [Ruminococcus sp.]
MKKIIAVLAAIILFTSCGTPESAESITTPTTTTAATFEMTTTAETTITEKAIETEFQPIIVYSELNIADFESVSAKSEEEYYYDYDISFIDGKADFDYSNLIEVEKYNELFIYSDDKNLNDIVANDSIEILNVCQTSTADLKGIENFNSLKVFNFYMYNVNIKDISDIKKSPAIERVHLNYADSVEDFSPLGELKNLKYLSITSQTLPGIEAISNCKELEFLYLYNFKEL